MSNMGNDCRRTPKGRPTTVDLGSQIRRLRGFASGNKSGVKMTVLETPSGEPSSGRRQLSTHRDIIACLQQRRLRRQKRRVARRPGCLDFARKRNSGAAIPHGLAADSGSRKAVAMSETATASPTPADTSSTFPPDAVVVVERYQRVEEERPTEATIESIAEGL